ncbi:MAG: hypothetical protein ABI833_17230 [Acidobacteriota bacterium]
MSELVFLGYCVKRTLTKPIASVSECLSKRPDKWVERWDFNRATCWNTEAEAWACVPDVSKPEFGLFAYAVLPMLFDASGIEKPVTIDQLFSSYMPDLPRIRPDYQRIGYDVVERNAAMGMLGFGCSPLSCNGMAESVLVNEICLIDDLESAMAAARRFGVEQPEPGPYVIVEVLAKR